MSILLLKLAGPMQSWGTQSRFSVRDTGLEPSRSGVVGLLCCALGRPRTASIDDFHPDKLEMGVRVDREGRMARDWHTALDVAKAGGGPSKDCEPSQRYYLADAEFLVALRGDLAFLNELQAALISPVWPLFLGRKSFVPSEPVWQRSGLQEGDNVETILRLQPWVRSASARHTVPPTRLRLVLEADPLTMSQCPDVIDSRHDVPLSFADRRFTVRHVRTAWIDRPETSLPIPSESNNVFDEADTQSTIS